MKKSPVFRKGSLSGSFLSVIALIYIVVSSLTVYIFSESVRTISSRYAAGFAVTQNILEKNRIMSIVERDLVLSLKLADDPLIISWMQDDNNPELKQAAFLQLESYRKLFRDKALFAAGRKSSRYYARTPASLDMMVTELDPDNPEDRWFYTALEENIAYSLNVDHNAMLKENRVWINAVARDSTGYPVGLAGCGMDLTAFLEALVTHDEPGITTVIINKDGDLQAYHDSSLIDYNASVTEDSDKIDIYALIPGDADRKRLKQAVRDADYRQEPEVFPLIFEDDSVLCAISALPELGWYNLVFIDADRILSAADFIPFAAVTGLSLLSVLAAVLLSINRLVLKPLYRLTGAASEIAAGSYNTALPADKNNEIGRLSASFNVMAEKIREYTNNLENLVEKRTAELTEANRLITDSIHYAQLIQKSLLPDDEELDSCLEEWFYILKPLDIVGGDFIFFRKSEKGFITAVIDCTGHGVPGAFMTMMVNALLNRIVETMQESSLPEMIYALHTLVQETLKKRAGLEHVQNGLDIALCRYAKKTMTLEFSGAGLPLYLSRGNDTSEIAGSRVYVGFSLSREFRMPQEQIIKLENRDKFYMVSDGILDLPGGGDGFGLGRRKLKQLVAGAGKISLKEQENYFKKELNKHRGSNNQRDDITFFGFSINTGEEN